MTQSASLPSVSSHRRGVVGLLVLLFAITYLDRVCISVAGPRMQEELGIDPIGWGWVTGMFTLAYCLFEIPTGMMGDRLGPRRVLTRIVVWWSAFTALTGAMTELLPAAASPGSCSGPAKPAHFPMHRWSCRAGFRRGSAPRCRA